LFAFDFIPFLRRWRRFLDLRTLFRVFYRRVAGGLCTRAVDAQNREAGVNRISVNLLTPVC
jgi:hypothetical protein